MLFSLQNLSQEKSGASQHQSGRNKTNTFVISKYQDFLRLAFQVYTLFG